MPASTVHHKLIKLLQLAYSAELAAAYAYRGHWRSLTDKEERARVEQIENEEWHHRTLAGEMLSKLGAQPSRQREVRALIMAVPSVYCVTYPGIFCQCMLPVDWRVGTFASMN